MRLCIRALLHALRKPFPRPPSKKRGRRSADRRTTGSAPAQKRKPASVCGARYVRLCPHWRGTKEAARSPFGRCPKPPGSGCMARPRAPHSLHIREYPREGVPDERAGGLTVTGTFVTSRLRDRDHKCDDQSRSGQRWKSPCLTGVTGLHFTMERLDLVR